MTNQLESRECVHVFYRKGGGTERMTALFINGTDIMEAAEIFQTVKKGCRITKMQKYDRLGQAYLGDPVFLNGDK